MTNPLPPLSYPTGLDQLMEALPARDFAEWKKRCTDETYATLQQLACKKSVTGFEVMQTDYLLLRLLEKAGQERRELAWKMHSFSAEKYGLLRTTPLEGEEITHLSGPKHRELNQYLRIRFAKFFPRFQENVESFGPATSISRHTVERIDSVRLRELIAQVERAPYLSEEENQKNNELVALLNAIGAVSDYVYTLFPDLQRPEELDVGPLRIGSLQFLVNTVESNISDQWKTLTRQITWLNQEHVGPIEERTRDYFEQYGFVTLLHSPREDLPFHFKTLENLTQRLATFTYQTPKEFHRELAVWDFLLFQIRPFYRDSAVIVEIVREAICRWRGETVPDRIEEQALSSLFIEAYLKLPSTSALPSKNGC